jgi:hypothetical protein
MIFKNKRAQLNLIEPSVIIISEFYPFENSGYASIPSSEISKPLISASSSTLIPKRAFNTYHTMPEVMTTKIPTIIRL